MFKWELIGDEPEELYVCNVNLYPIISVKLSIIKYTNNFYKLYIRSYYDHDYEYWTFMFGYNYMEGNYSSIEEAKAVVEDRFMQLYNDIKSRM